MEHFFGVYLAFLKIPRSRKQKKYVLNFSKSFGKIALSGVAGSERKIIVKRVEKPLANVLSAKGSCFVGILPTSLLNDLQNGETA